MNKYQDQVHRILAFGHSEEGARALAASTPCLTASADGFAALNEVGVVNAAPPQDAKVYVWTWFTLKASDVHHVQRKYKIINPTLDNLDEVTAYPHTTNTRFWFDATENKMHFCSVRQSRFNELVYVSDNEMYEALIKRAELNK